MPTKAKKNKKIERPIELRGELDYDKEAVAKIIAKQIVSVMHSLKKLGNGEEPNEKTA